MGTLKANFITSASGGGPSVKGESAAASKAAGYIGEILSSTAQGSGVTVGTSPIQLANLSITAGLWLVTVAVNLLVTNAATNDGSFALSTTNNSYSGSALGYDQFNIYTLAANGRSMGSFSKIINISSTTVHYLNVTSRGGGCNTGDWLGSIVAVRIA